MAKKEKTPEEKARNRQKSNENLLSAEYVNSRMTPEERRERASKAGKASAEKKKANRLMMDMARRILDMPVGEAYKVNRDIMHRYGIDDNEMTYGVAILATMALKGMNGDVNAAKFIRDSAGFDSMTVLKEEQFEYMKENGQNINVNLDGELTTKSRVHIYLPERDEDPE